MSALNVLVIEDARSDFLLLKRCLERQKLEATLHCIMSAAELDEALKEDWDALLTDYSVPGMDFERSLRAVRQRRPEIPVILISGSIGEERAVELLRLGVTDFVLKDRLERLPHAIQTAVSERLERRARDAQEKRNDLDRLRSERVTAIGGMAAALAHEINQPFMATIAYIDTARELLRNPDLKHHLSVEQALELATEQLLRAGHIMTHLRGFVSTGEPDKTFRSLHQLVRAAIDSMSPGQEPIGLQLVYELNAETDRVLVDKVQIKQVLVNLVRNARQAMENSPSARIVVSSSIEDDKIRLDIADTGCGLDPETIEDLFEPFITSKPKGMGLGLAISRAIIEAHYGTLSAFNNALGGATFRILIPLEREQ